MPHGLPDFWQGTIAGMPAIGAGQVAWYMSGAKLVDPGATSDLINYVVPDTFELHVCSGVVSCGLPRLQRYDLRQTPAATWISPIGHSDPYNVWRDEEKLYDGNIDTRALVHIPISSWGRFIELLINPTFINKLRFIAGWVAGIVNQVDMDAYYEGAWHDVYEGVFPNMVWLEKALDDTFLVEKARIRLHNPHPTSPIDTSAAEFLLNTTGASPQEGIYFDTHAIIPYLPQAPYIIEPRATFAVRVYNDDAEPQNMSVSLAGFLQRKTM